MSDVPRDDEPEKDDGVDDEAPPLTDDDPIRALLRGAMKDSPPPAIGVLSGVQKKLRERSRGKFYGDGWSTAQQTTSTLLVALLMLVVLGAAYYALGPMSVAR